MLEFTNEQFQKMKNKSEDELRQSRRRLTKNTTINCDALCWYLATVWINIDRERASPSKYLCI